MTPSELLSASVPTSNLRLALAGLMVLALQACATTGQPGFTKIKTYHLKAEDRRSESLSIDPMIRFERQHFLHGAATLEEKHSRLGHYYTFFWEADPAGGPVTLKFRYRQTLSGERVFTYEHVTPAPDRRNQSSFAIVGDAYHPFGRVVAWEAEIWQGDRLLDTTRSFLWQ